MNPERWKRYASWLAAVALVYWLFIFYLTHAPNLGQVGPPGTDKVAHFSIFACLAALLGLVACLWWGFSLRLLAGVWFVAATYGVFDELSQLLVVSRTSSFWDWLADAAGSFVGVMVIAAIFWLMRSAGAAKRET